MLKNVTFSAGEMKEFREENDFFRILGTTVGSVDLKFLRDGAEIADAPGVSAGYAEKFNRAFDTVQITSATAQAVQFVTRYGSDVRYDIQSTQAIAMNGALTQAAATVATASGQLLAAKATRRYLFIQNNDANLTIYINLAGAAAAAATGIKIAPGGAYENDKFPPTSQINAISIGSANSLITVVEG